VYLEVPVDTIVDRVAGDATERPLLQDDTGAPLPRDQQRSRIEQMLDARRSSYEAAHRTIDADSPVETVVTDLVQVVTDRSSF
jgi:shikimate kinase